MKPHPLSMLPALLEELERSTTGSNVTHRKLLTLSTLPASSIERCALETTIARLDASLETIPDVRRQGRAWRNQTRTPAQDDDLRAFEALLEPHRASLEALHLAALDLQRRALERDSGRGSTGVARAFLERDVEHATLIRTYVDDSADSAHAMLGDLETFRREQPRAALPVNARTRLLETGERQFEHAGAFLECVQRWRTAGLGDARMLATLETDLLGLLEVARKTLALSSAGEP